MTLWYALAIICIKCMGWIMVKSRYYQNDYSKRIKAYYKNKERKAKIQEYEQKKESKTFFDRLFLRIFLSSLLMLCIVGGERLLSMTKIDFKINHFLTNNINFIKFAKFFNGGVFSIIPDDEIIDVYEENVYDFVEYEGGVNIVKNETFAGAVNLVSGYVTRIVKNETGYHITIKGVDGLEYEYLELESIDFHIYEYVKAGEVIGKARFDDVYQFKLIISENDEVYSFYEKAN